MYLYAIRDESTGKLLTNITKPSHKFWEKEGMCKAALNKHIRRLTNKKIHCTQSTVNPENLKIVKFELIEVFE